MLKTTMSGHCDNCHFTSAEIMAGIDDLTGIPMLFSF